MRDKLQTLRRFRRSLTVIFTLAILISVCTVGPAVQEEPTEAIAPLVVGAAIGIAAVAGLIAGYWLGENTDAMNDAALSGVVDTYGNNIRTIVNNGISHATTYRQNMEALAEASLNYKWMRQAEYAAQELYQRQEQGDSTVPEGFDTDWVIGTAGCWQEAYEIWYGMNAQYDAAFNSLSTVHQTFVGDYSEMSIEVKGEKDSGAGSTLLEISTSDGPLEVISTSALLDMHTDGNDGSSYFYAMAGANLTLYEAGTNGNDNTVTLYDLNDETVWQYNYTQNSQNNIYELPTISTTGIYKIGHAGTQSMYAITPAQDTTAVWPVVDESDWAPLRIIVNDEGTFEYGLCWKSGDTYQALSWDDLSTYYHSVWKYRIEPPYVETTSVPVDVTDDFMDDTRSWMTTANAAAQAYYNLLVGGADPAYTVPPDALFPSPSQMEGMSWEEIYAMMVVWMSQWEVWFEENQFMDLTNATISINSPHVMVRGAIYNETHAEQHDNTTVFSPYVTVESMTVELGNNTMVHPGMAFIWGQNSTIAERIEYLNQTPLSTMDYTILEPNWYFIAEEIYYMGEPVDNVTLVIETYDYWDDGEDDEPPTAPGSMTDLEWVLAHWYYVAGVFGIILLLGGIVIRNTGIVIVGGILAVIALGGWLLSDLSAGDLLGGLLEIRR